MQMKKFIIILSVILVAISIGILYHEQSRKKLFETYSARVMQESVNVNSDYDGIISQIYVKNGQDIKLGDKLFEIQQNLNKSNCLTVYNTQSQQEAEAEYKDAALMYKDGVITKEEYDKSLDEYQDNKEDIKPTVTCNSAQPSLITVAATDDGTVSIEDNLLSKKVSKGDTLAIISPKKRTVLAYYSPKLKKKIKPNMETQITFIKYPEKIFTGKILEIKGIDINGVSVIISVNEDLSDLTIKDNDDAIVKLLK